MGVKSFGPGDEGAWEGGRAAAGERELTDATLVADSATAVAAEASPIWAPSGAAHERQHGQDTESTDHARTYG